MLGLLLSIALLVIDVMFHSRYYFSQVRRWPLDEGLFEVSLPKTIIEYSYKIFLISTDYLDCYFLEVGEVLPQGF